MPAFFPSVLNLNLYFFSIFFFLFSSDLCDLSHENILYYFLLLILIFFLDCNCIDLAILRIQCSSLFFSSFFVNNYFLSSLEINNYFSKFYIYIYINERLTRETSGKMLALEPPSGLGTLRRATPTTCTCLCQATPARLSAHRRNSSARWATQRIVASQRNLNKHLQDSTKPRVFLLDVNPLCYEGSKPSLRSFARWISLFFSEVSLQDPVIAVLDGEQGNEYRRTLMPSYKAHRRKFLGPLNGGRSSKPSEAQVTDALRKCNVPVIKVSGYEADDVVATLTDQVLQRGFRVVIGSPDKDFKQLISEDVQMVMPVSDFGRWSFYTLRHYIAQYNCDPSSDLSLRCLIGDEIDGVPGIQHVVPGFGRKTALKLLKKHGSLPNLLAAAAVRTVGKQYAQEALIKHADYLRKNYDVLSLRRDAAVQLEEEWLLKRDSSNDSTVLSTYFIEKLSKSHNFNVRCAS